MDELPLVGVVDEMVDQHIAFLLRQAENATDVRCEIQGSAPRLRKGARNDLRHWRKMVILHETACYSGAD
jgi:hypothetical protein